MRAGVGSKLNRACQAGSVHRVAQGTAAHHLRLGLGLGVVVRSRWGHPKESVLWHMRHSCGIRWYRTVQLGIGFRFTSSDCKIAMSLTLTLSWGCNHVACPASRSGRVGKVGSRR